MIIFLWPVCLWKKMRRVSEQISVSHRYLPSSCCPGDPTLRVTKGLFAGTRTAADGPVDQLLAVPRSLYSAPPEPSALRPGSNLEKAWQSSMAAWKWVQEPLEWIIPLRLNCCLNSGSHKLYCSCFIKKQSWWMIHWTHYMENYLPKEGPEP